MSSEHSDNITTTNCQRPAPSSTQQTLQLKARSAIITPPPRARSASTNLTLPPKVPFEMNENEGKSLSSTTKTTMHVCQYCNRVKFPTKEEAKDHEDKCKEHQIQIMKSCRNMLKNVDLKALSAADSEDDDVCRVMKILSRLDSLDHVDIVNIKVLNSIEISTPLKTLKKCKNEQIKSKTKAILDKWAKVNGINKSTAAGSNNKKGEMKSNSTKSKARRNEMKNSFRNAEEEKKQDEINPPSLQPPPKKQKKNPTLKPVASIFLPKKKDSTVTSSQSSIKSTSNKSKAQSKPLASIFCTKTKVAENHRQPNKDNQSSSEVCPEFLIHDEAILEEHRKAELLLKQQQLNKEKRCKKKRKQTDCTNKEKPRLAKIFGMKNKDTVHSSTPMKDKKIKGSGASANSPVDLTTPPPRKNNKIEKSISLIDQTKKKEEELLYARLSYLRKSAPNFPVPNHIIANNEDQISLDCNHSHENHFLSDLRDSLRRTPKFQHGHTNVSTDNDNINDTKLLNQIDKSNDAKHDALHVAFSTVLQPSPKDDTRKNPLLWSDKYSINAIPNDVHGEENKLTAQDLISFVNEWKEKREEAIRAAEEAHRKRKGLKKQKKKNSKKKQYDYDDDFLSDSEDEYGLSKIYILCGPTSSGKSSLVYAVAKKCQCYVLEINSTDDRSGTSLKKTIEESTQSHSSLGLLKRKNNILFEGEMLDDTDDEQEQKPSLAIILIDEVDLLFENDVGFWQSLSSVAKKARCPIILTAPHPPTQMVNSNVVQYRYGYLTKPSPMECASKMCQISRMENMPWNSMDGTEVKEGLASIAKMCNCDLRKIMNEMQLFNHGSTIVEEKWRARSSDEIHKSTLPGKESFSFESILPKKVSANSSSLLKIKFKQCLENVSSIRVVIGDQLITSTKLIDPNNILVICPPCVIPAHVDESGLIKKIYERSLQCMYKSILIEITFRGGQRWRSDFPYSLDFKTPLMTYEFPEQQSILVGTETQPDEFLNSHEEVKMRFNKYCELVNGDLGSNNEPVHKKEEEKSCNELNNLLQYMTNSSDAALLDDELNETCLPHIAGGIAGCHDSSEFESGIRYLGGSDLYMTRTMSHRDRCVQSRTCNLARGLSTFDPEICNYIPEINPDTKDFDDSDLSGFNTEETTAISDEDMFLSSTTNVGTQAALFIKSYCETKETAFMDNDMTFEKDRLNRMEKLTTMTNSILTENRQILGRNSNNGFNYSIALDYLPTLRNIGALEKKADEIFETLKANPLDAESFTSHSRRRATRSRGALTRDHYFVNIMDCEDIEAKELGNCYAEMKLSLVK